MYCAISGQVPQTPVFCAKTGLIYEQRLIEKAVEAEGGKCPVTNQALSLPEDLAVVKTSPVSLPRPPTGSSFPSLLTTLQNEWDSLVLEQVALRKELLETRKDLASALYEREAASGVIARLLKENDQLKAKLEGLSKTTESEGDGAMETDDFAQEVTALSSALQEKRMQAFKKGATPGGEGLTVISSETSAKEVNSFNPHKSRKPGVTCLARNLFDITAAQDKMDWLVSGGNDGELRVLDVGAEQIVGSWKAHSGAVNDVSLCGQVVASASQDKTFTIWKGAWPQAGKGENVSLESHHVMKLHSKGVQSCPMHPSGKFVGSVGTDGKWTLVDVEEGKQLLSYEFDTALSCGRFHPDGSLLAVGGKQGVVSLFNVSQDVSKGPAGELNHEAPVNFVAFSENGYTCATAGDDGMVKVWDLRKIKVQTALQSASEGAPVTSLAFDATGSYLAFGDEKGGVGISVKPKKKGDWTTVVKTFEHKKRISGLVFTPGATNLYTSSLDKYLKCISLVN